MSDTKTNSTDQLATNIERLEKLIADPRVPAQAKESLINARDALKKAAVPTELP